MSDTSIRPARDAMRSIAESKADPLSDIQIRKKSLFMIGLGYLASLRVTVVLFLLSIFLVFIGTLAMRDLGNWTVVNKYFRSYWVMVPFQVFMGFAQVFLGVSPRWQLGDSWFPYPGGFTLSVLLLVNLLAAHLVRFKISWKRAGIFLIHGGLILMLVGEWFAYHQVEGRLRVQEGESSNYVFHTTSSEIAITTPAADGKNDEVVVIPQSLLKQGRTISDPKLPFDVVINKFMANSRLLDGKRKGGVTYPVDQGHGLQNDVEERKEGAGVDANAPENCPSTYVTLLDKQNKQPLGSYLLSTYFTDLLRMEPQQSKVGDKNYTVDLRYKRTYKPYSIYLNKVTSTMYPGTDIPRDYHSIIRLQDPTRNEDRTIKIAMNDPLRYAGEAFFQSGVDGNATILQVVRNPGWLLPYLSCIIVSIGMTVHFIQTLVIFLNNRRALSRA